MPLTSNIPKDGKRSLDAAPHPVFAKVMQDVEVVKARLVIREERFEFWAKRLVARYPRRENKLLYRQLFAAAILLAPHRAPAALQLFALACLGLHPVLAWRAARTDHAFCTQEAQQLRVQTEVVGLSGLSAAIRPSNGAGVSIATQRRRS